MCKKFIILGKTSEKHWNLEQKVALKWFSNGIFGIRIVVTREVHVRVVTRYDAYFFKSTVVTKKSVLQQILKNAKKNENEQKKTGSRTQKYAFKYAL